MIQYGINYNLRLLDQQLTINNNNTTAFVVHKFVKVQYRGALDFDIYIYIFQKNMTILKHTSQLQGCK